MAKPETAEEERQAPEPSIGILEGPVPDFAFLTFPRYRKRLTEASVPALALGARIGASPAGLMLVNAPDEEGAARLLSVMTAPPYRRTGIARALIQAGAVAAAKRRTASLISFHSSRLPAAPAYEALLAGTGWSALHSSDVRLAAHCVALLRAMTGWPGVRRLLVRSDFAVAPWRERTGEDRQETVRIVASPLCRASLRPDHWRRAIEPDVSVLIRHGGRLAGWVIVVMMDRDEGEMPGAYCPAAYIAPELWRSGGLVLGIQQSLMLIAEKYGDECQVRFRTGASFPGMLKLTLRRFAPAALWVDEWRVARLVL